MNESDDLFADALIAMIRDMTDAELHNVAEVVRQVQIERAIGGGDEDAIIASAFETAFGRDGLPVLPWVEGNVVVCPGGMVSKSKASHKCRFVSVDDTWIWESHLLLREDKRSSTGTDEGFRAVALLPLVDGTGIDVVSGKARSGQHRSTTSSATRSAAANWSRCPSARSTPDTERPAPAPPQATGDDADFNVVGRRDPRVDGGPHVVGGDRLRSAAVDR